MRVELEPDPVPLARITASLVRRSLAAWSGGGPLARARGVIVLASATDPQAVTLRIGADCISIRRGADTDADVSITMDLGDSDAKPKVEGAAKHPVLALAAAKLLEPPVGDWQTEADRFFESAMAHADCPRPVRLVATDVDGPARQQQWGGAGDPAIEIHGQAARLAAAMSGSAVVAEEVLNGRLFVVADLRDLSLLTKYAIDHLFGELV